MNKAERMESYCQPVIEIIECSVEQGFANSVHSNNIDSWDEIEYDGGFLE